MTRVHAAKKTSRKYGTLQHANHKAAAAAVILGTAAVVLKPSSSYIKTPMHTSILTGHAWVQELLHGHALRFYNQFGLEKFVFKAMLRSLARHTNFSDSKYITAEEKLAIYLYACRTGLSNRKLQERFQRSADTISRCVILHSIEEPGSFLYV